MTEVKVAIIVAHPDDETLWVGGTIPGNALLFGTDPNLAGTVICVHTQIEIHLAKIGIDPAQIL